MGIVAVNNHYGGFGPGTVNMFREMMDMEQVAYDQVDMQKLNSVKEVEDSLNLNRWKGSQRKEESKQHYLILWSKL
ncbi:MAG: hypothetical protein ACRD9Q_00875 [Nitrososphaeraceae archaeon]